MIDYEKKDKSGKLSKITQHKVIIENEYTQNKYAREKANQRRKERLKRIKYNRIIEKIQKNDWLE